MADVPFADVFRPVRCNQTVIASDARNPIWRVIVSRDDDHDTSLVISQYGFIVVIQHWATPLRRCCRRGPITSRDSYGIVVEPVVLVREMPPFSHVISRAGRQKGSNLEQFRPLTFASLTINYLLGDLLLFPRDRRRRNIIRAESGRSGRVSG